MTREEAIELVKRVAKDEGYDVALALAQCQAESNFRDDAVSPVGARGLMQLMPATAEELGVSIDSPEQNVRGGLRFMAGLRREFISVQAALAAYNWGPGHVRTYMARHQNDWPWYVPAETHHYVGAILRGWQIWQQQLALAAPAK